MENMLAFIGSPRRSGNCDILVHRHAIKGTKTATAPSRGFRHPREGAVRSLKGGTGF